MTSREYFRRAQEAFDDGRITAEAYDAMMMNADVFCDDDDEDYVCNLPDTYAEIQYEDFDSPEAVMGARFDDLNYTRYMER